MYFGLRFGFTQRILHTWTELLGTVWKELGRAFREDSERVQVARGVPSMGRSPFGAPWTTWLALGRNGERWHMLSESGTLELSSQEEEASLARQGCPPLRSVAMMLKPSLWEGHSLQEGEARVDGSCPLVFPDWRSCRSVLHRLVPHPHRTLPNPQHPRHILLSCRAGLPAAPLSCNLTSDNPSPQLPSFPLCPFV